MLLLLRPRSFCTIPSLSQHIPLKIPNASASRRISHVASCWPCRPRYKAWTGSPPIRRHESTVAREAKNEAYKYPELLNVYRAGTGPTATIGTLRVLTVVIFALGTLGGAPAFYFSSDHSNLWIPLAMIASAVPLVVATLATGPMVHAIHVRLPTLARRSKKELIQFADHTPSDTVLQLHYMKLLPWPTKGNVRFGDLRKLKPSFREGISNLEHVPDHVKKHNGTVWFRLAQGYFGRFYVMRDQRKDRSAAPGVWAKMWEQLPSAGSKHDPILRKPRKVKRSVAMANRPQRPPERPVPPQRPNRR